MIVLSVTSRVSAVGGNPVAAQDLGDLARQVEVGQVAYGQVDRHAQGEAGRLPAGHLRDGHLEHLHGQRLDQAGVLGRGDELLRHEQPELGVLPADEGLDADDLSGTDVALRLVVQVQLVVVDAAAQVTEQGQPLRGVQVVVRAVDHEAAAGLLGGVERDVGPAEQGLAVLAVHGRQRDADAGLDVEGDVRDEERGLQRPADPAGELAGALPRPRRPRPARTRRRRAGPPCRPRGRAWSAARRPP